MEGVEPPRLHYECYLEGGTKWCSTRKHWNDSHITGEFGTCSATCDANLNSTADLASTKFDPLWDEGFYRLFKDDIGHCHTYNPSHKSSTSPDQRFVALLGGVDNDVTNGYYDGFYVYLHEKGQFWPSASAMEKLGQPKSLFIPRNTEQECSFTLVERVSLRKSFDGCTDKLDYSFTACVFNYLAERVGCQIPWVYTSLHSPQTVPACRTKKEMFEYDSLLASVESLSGIAIANLSGCPVRCTVRQFSFAECKAERVSWKREWSSAFYFGAERTEVRREEEFWIFDSSDTLNGIGGALGLFLGWSVLYLANQIAVWILIIYKKILPNIAK